MIINGKALGRRHTVEGGSGRIIIVANGDNVFRQEWYPGTSSKDYGVTLVELD